MKRDLALVVAGILFAALAIWALSAPVHDERTFGSFREHGGNVLGL